MNFSRFVNITIGTALRTLATGAALLAPLAFAGTSFAVEPTVLFNWDFETDADVAAWSRNCLSQPKSEDGALVATYTDWDPFVVGPRFELKPRPGQVVEIRMKSTGSGSGELFYASSNEGPYGGFSQSKTASWDVAHDGEWHVYRVLPNWLAEPQIIKMRVDVGRPTQDEINRGCGLAIDYIRVVDLNVDQAEPLSPEKADWSGDALAGSRFVCSNGDSGWRSEIFKLDPAQVGNALYLEGTIAPDFKPSTPFPMARVSFLSAASGGLVTFDVPLTLVATEEDANADAGSERIFRQNVDLSNFAAWNGVAYCWELVLPKGLEARRVALGSKPQGPGSLDYRLGGPNPAICRLNRDGAASVEYEAIVRNNGGETLRELVATARLAQTADGVKFVKLSARKTAVDSSFGTNPSGDRLTLSRPDESNIDPTVWNVAADADGSVAFPSDLTLAPGEALRIVATYSAERTARFAPKLAFSAKSVPVDADAQTAGTPVELATLTTSFDVLPELALEPADYVPEPRPLSSEYEIGAFYFPGWSQRSGWDKIDVAAPIRKPILGWYDEGNPEVVDWQIKWAAENGIQFFFVDWYWRNGTISLDHWVRAFQQAKHRKYLKWAVMWANHTGPGTHSTKDWREVTQFWLDNYFNTPEYYRIDGKPVVVIWDQSLVDSDMRAEAAKEGVELKPGEGVKKAMEISRRMCVDAGLPGVYFIAMKWPEGGTDPRTIQALADAGFDATTIYHYMDAGDKPLADPKLYSFDDVAESSPKHWTKWNEAGILPFIPNISTGWDSRPWHGFRNTVVYGRTVDKFRRICEEYKKFADKTGVKRVVFAPVNEWGEGSYIEPNAEFGFGMYEAIRETLCKEPEGGFPANFAPSEVGLGPYDLPPVK